jgi:hypothetical protein
VGFAELRNGSEPRSPSFLDAQGANRPAPAVPDGEAVPPDTVDDALPTLSGADEALEEHAEQAAARTASHSATTRGSNLPAGGVESDNLRTPPSTTAQPDG